MKKFFQVSTPILSATIFAGIAALVLQTLRTLKILTQNAHALIWIYLFSYGAAIICGAILGILLFPSIVKGFNKAEEKLKTMPVSVLVTGFFGLLAGLLIAFLLTRFVDMIAFPWLRIVLTIILYIGLGSGGIQVALMRRKDLNLASLLQRNDRRDANDIPLPEEGSVKLLDTSVIIDGRIFDICKTGFLEGELVVPSFVLRELHAIADSEDDLKRIRGRRGLDVLTRLQKELKRPVIIRDVEEEDENDVDRKLIRLAEQLHSVILTNDLNLNKVARVHNIPVLNINDLANAVKPVAIPGETMDVRIIKTGKEPGQGVAYLDDGTMIVVEDAGQYISSEVTIVVTSALQTSAGRMIFGRLDA